MKEKLSLCMFKEWPGWPGVWDIVGRMTEELRTPGLSAEWEENGNLWDYKLSSNILNIVQKRGIKFILYGPQ